MKSQVVWTISSIQILIFYLEVFSWLWGRYSANIQKIVICADDGYRKSDRTFIIEYNRTVSIMIAEEISFETLQAIHYWEVL